MAAWLHGYSAIDPSGPMGLHSGGDYGISRGWWCMHLGGFNEPNTFKVRRTIIRDFITYSILYLMKTELIYSISMYPVASLCTE